MTTASTERWTEEQAETPGAEVLPCWFLVRRSG
jgi:hypothetical protein